MPNMSSSSSDTLLTAENFRRLSNYSRMVNKPLIQVINNACQRWMDQWGDLIIADIEGKRARQHEADASNIVFIGPRKRSTKK